MARLTKASSNKSYIVDDDKIIRNANGYSGEVVNKLAAFENIYEDLISNQDEISKEMEKLRSEDKTKSVKFRELMTKKLMNSHVISIIKAHGLE